MAIDVAQVAPRPRTGSSGWLRRRVSGLAGISSLLLAIAVFYALEPSTFGTVANFKVIVSQASIAAILAAGLSISLAAGAFDLSLSTVMAASGVIVAHLITVVGLPYGLAVVAAVAAGAAMGGVSGLLVAYGGIPSLIATLGIQAVIAGLLTRATDGKPINIAHNSGFTSLARGDLLGLPHEAWIMLILIAIGSVISRHAVVGRNLRAVGRNPAGSRLAGLNVRRYVAASLALTGAFAAVAGVVLAAKLSAGRPEVGSAQLLPAFAAAFLGAALSRDGDFNLPGALVGALLLTTITNGLVIASAPDWTNDFVTGLMLLGAVGLARLIRSHRTR